MAAQDKAAQTLVRRKNWLYTTYTFVSYERHKERKRLIN